MMKLNNKGFTLVELLAVLVVLSAIMGLAIPTFSSTLDRSKINQEEQRKERIESASEVYVTDNRDEIYSNLSVNEIDKCSIEVKKLVGNGYVNTEDATIDSTDYVIFTKSNNTYEYSENANGLSSCVREK